MKIVTIGLAAIIGATFFSGCMTSRGICFVMAPGEVRFAKTQNKYRISQIQEKLPGGAVVNVHSDSHMCELLGQAFDVEEMKSYTPGAWSEDGIPVTITFSDWRCMSEGAWSIAPCILTLGIFPYCHHDEICSRVTVTRDDGKGSATFSYAESDHWKVSYLFACGHIPYDEKLLARNEFQLCGSGDITAKPHFAGLAHGIVTALAEIERNTTNTKQK